MSRIILHDHEDGHCHEHTHTHTHEHCHDHEHDHDHMEDSATEGKCKEEKTLGILLSHWVEHNTSHEESFVEWIDKAKTIGKAETAEYINKAVEFMKKADEMLVEAKKHM